MRSFWKLFRELDQPRDGNKDTYIRRKVLVGTFSNYIGQIVSIGTLLFLTPFVLHHLGATAYGLWVLISSIVAYGSLLDFGIWGTIIKYVSEFRAREDHEQGRRLVATAFRLYLLLGMCVFLLSIVLAPFIPDLFHLPADQRSTAILLVILMGLTAGLSLPGMTQMAVLRGLQRYDIVNLVEITATLFTSGMTVLILLAGGGILGMVLANTSGLLVMLALSTRIIHRLAPELKFRRKDYERSFVRMVFSYSWPLFVKDFASRLQTKTDEITIGAFLPVSFIASYNIARRLSESTHVLTKQFMKVLLPLASELHARSDLLYLRQVYMVGTRLTLAISVSIGCTLILLARPILTLWVGPAYANAGSIVAILTLASFISTCQWPAGAVLQGMARHKVLAATSLCSGLANLVISIILVRPFGLTGVAIGTLIPNTIEFCVILPFTLRILNVNAGDAFKGIFFPALSPAIPMILVLYFFRQFVGAPTLSFLILSAGTGIAVYIFGYLLLGASKGERNTYRGIAFNLLRYAQAYWRRSE